MALSFPTSFSASNNAVVADGIKSNPCELKFLKLLTSWTGWLSRRLHFVGSGKNMSFVMLCLLLNASTFATCGTGIGSLSFSASTGFLIAWYHRKVLPTRFVFDIRPANSDQAPKVFSAGIVRPKPLKLCSKLVRMSSGTRLKWHSSRPMRVSLSQVFAGHTNLER